MGRSGVRIWASTVITLLHGVASAQTQLPHMVGTNIRVVVSEQSPGVWRYRYTVQNSRGNLRIVNFAVDISTDPSRAEVSSEGLDNSASLRSGIRLADRLGLTKIVGVAFPTSPGGWKAGVSGGMEALWGTVEDSSSIAVGFDRGGYEMLSRGMPGIRSATVEANFVALHEGRRRHRNRGDSVRCRPP